MNSNQDAANQRLAQARQALKEGDRLTARRLAEQAAQAAPELEETWLLLASLVAPRASLAYLEKALEINPQSERAQKGLAWAKERISTGRDRPSELRQPVSKPTATPKKKARRRLQPAYLFLAALFLCIGIAAVAFVAISPAMALIRDNLLASLPVGNGTAAPSVINSATAAASETSAPTFTPTLTLSPTAIFTATFTATATQTLTATPTLAPSITPTDEPSPTPLPTDTPEPTQVIPPTAALPAPGARSSSGGGGPKWIEVDLSEQMLYAWEGKTLVASFLVSTGVAGHRTITGSYPIYEKHLTANMWGPGYYLPDVPYTMYFYKGYALHGTYWHSNFGTPMSHGCVNLSTSDAEWLYYWAPIGTSVKVHY